MFTRKNTALITLALIALLGFLGIKYSGLHLDGLKLVQGGSVVLLSVTDDVQVFLDNKEVRSEELENVSPGRHTIILANDALWPWKKDFVVNSNEAAHLYPFLVSKNVSGELITQADPEYITLRNRILGEQLPTQTAPLLSPSNLVEVWSAENNIFARWNGPEDDIPDYFCNDEGACSSLVQVLESDSEVRNIDFYKGRDDVLLIASQNGVFAIEIDRRGGTQNFQPVYKGTASPRFTTENTEIIYVLDGALLFSVAI